MMTCSGIQHHEYTLSRPHNEKFPAIYSIYTVYRIIFDTTMLLYYTMLNIVAGAT